MATPKTAPLSSNQPDLGILSALGVMHRVLLVLVTAFSGITLAGWLIHPLGRLLPFYWSLMKANVALMVFLSCLSITLSEPRRSKTAVRISRLLAGPVILIAAVFFCERLYKISLP